MSKEFWRLRDAARTIRILAVVATSHVPARIRNLALEEIDNFVSQDDPCVAQGGTMPTSPSALALWDKNRKRLSKCMLGESIALLETLEKIEHLAPRIRAIKGILLTFSEVYLREKLAK